MSYVLIVDDEEPFRRLLETTVAAMGHSVQGVGSGEEALSRMDRAAPALVLLDLRMGPRSLDGLATLREIRARFGDLPVALITGYGDVPSAVAAMKLGALDFLEKPIDLDEVRQLVADMVGAGSGQAAPADGEPLPFGGITPVDAHFQKRLQLLAAAAESNAPVLISGESGTGKEVAASFVHARSARAEGPFVKVNCAAIPGSLLESEMFGHEAGAFTGAERATAGRFEAADGGTLLLDEIAEMEPALQAKLLRVLQEKELERVGATTTRAIDVRVVATTNQDLPQAIADKTFREDLYFRLNVFEVVLPPLRDHRADILPLAKHFIERHAPGKRRKLSSLAEAMLQAHRFPGNVRELGNAMERAVILARGGVIHAEHLPPTMGAAPAVGPAPAGEAVRPGTTVHDMERALIIQTLAAHDGNRTHAAKAMGMSRRALLYKIKRYGLG
ncbi:MAG: sigma-54-dependent Fis family transcriptional regulator [Deltaproteobacteria bacterium]|nr:sigma-54-dependent Fis family transcriptional regulator [Deltaproteobacteria bacterium]